MEEKSLSETHSTGSLLHLLLVTYPHQDQPKKSARPIHNKEVLKQFLPSLFSARRFEFPSEAELPSSETPPPHSICKSEAKAPSYLEHTNNAISRILLG